MQFLSKAHITHIHPHLNKDKLFKCLTARLKSTHPSLQRAAAAMAAAAPGPAPAPPTLRDVLFSLEDLEIKPWAAKCLLAGMHLLENAQASLAQRPPAADETIDQQNGVLLKWLAGVYCAVNGCQAMMHGDLLQPEFTASGMLAPFVQHNETSTATRFGVPSTPTSVLCDSASELLRMAGAALVALHTYLTYRQGPGDLPGDEVTLVLSTISINSCADAANAATVDAQLAALVAADLDAHGSGSVWHHWPEQQQEQQQPDDAVNGHPRIGCAEIRWLMHFIRGLTSHYMAAVAHVLEDKNQQAACYYAQQKDMQHMCKALPHNPLGYQLFARCAMNGQQMQLAAAFLQRGLGAAKAVGADTAVAVMSFQRAAALLLGGAGAGAGAGTASDADAAGPQVDAAEVAALLEDGERSREAVLAWWPSAWAAAAPDGEPDRSLVQQKLLPAYEARMGAPLPASGMVDALTGLLYVTKPPDSIPAGALQHVIAAGGVEVEEGGGA